MHFEKLRTLIFFKVRLYRSFQITLKKIEKTNFAWLSLFFLFQRILLILKMKRFLQTLCRRFYCTLICQDFEVIVVDIMEIKSIFVAHVLWAIPIYLFRIVLDIILPR